MSMSSTMEEGTARCRDGSPLSPAQANRRRWLSVLARASLGELDTVLSVIKDIIGSVPAAHYLRKPEIGMAMVRGRMGGTGRPFNFSEMTMTRCTLQLDDGRLGCAYIAGRKKSEAERVALIDALLQDAVHGDRLIAQTIDPLAAEQAGRAKARIARSAPTKVEFFTLVREENPA